jgi:hypothetical protein
LRRQRRIVLEDDREGADAGVAFEGAAAGEHFIEHGAEGEDVGAGIELFGVHLFGGHVGDGSEDVAVFRTGDRLMKGLGGFGFSEEGRVGKFGEAEVEDFDDIFGGHHDVGFLDGFAECL